MKAFAATYTTDSRRSEAEGVCDYYLPEVHCGACGETWMDTEVWYPSLSLTAKAVTARFTRELTVKLEELENLRGQLAGLGHRKLRLPPGAGLGPVRARLPQNPTDFVWCGGKLLAARSAVAILANKGVRLPHGPAVVRVGAKGVGTYVALELDPIPLYDAATLSETTLTYCAKCGSCEMKDLRANLKGLKRYVRAKMPPGQGLVRVNESASILATEDFMHAMRSERLTGLDFDEAGVYA